MTWIIFAGKRKAADVKVSAGKNNCSFLSAILSTSFKNATISFWCSLNALFLHFCEVSFMKCFNIGMSCDFENYSIYHWNSYAFIGFQWKNGNWAFQRIQNDINGFGIMVKVELSGRHYVSPSWNQIFYSKIQWMESNSISRTIWIQTFEGSAHYEDFANILFNFWICFDRQSDIC